MAKVHPNGAGGEKRGDPLQENLILNKPRSDKTVLWADVFASRGP